MMEPEDEGENRGGEGNLQKQQVNSRTGGIELHLLEINEETKEERTRLAMSGRTSWWG